MQNGMNISYLFRIRFIFESFYGEPKGEIFRTELRFHEVLNSKLNLWHDANAYVKEGPCNVIP